MPLQARDRKSTRLNSSHLVISYAVFCLKKKTLESPHDYVCNRRLRNQRIFQEEIEIAGNSAAQLRVTIFPALQPDSTTPVEVQKPCFSNCGYRMRRRFLQMY